MSYVYSDFGLDKTGPHFAWLDARLTLHGFPPTRLMMNLKDRVQRFQLSQGWTGSGADGIVGPKTLARLTADPVEHYDFPADLFGINWKLTTVTGIEPADRRLIEVKVPELAAYTGPRCFLRDNAVIFRSYHGDPTTSGSSNPRSELREMANGGLNLAKWDGHGARRSMVFDVAVTRLTTVRPYTVVGQIHDPDDDVTTFRFEGIKGTNLAKIWASNYDTSRAKLVLDGYRLGDRVRLGFHVDDGLVTFSLGGRAVPDFEVNVGADCYWKLGAYLQSNPTSAPTESKGAFTEVALHDLDMAVAA